MRNDFVLTYKRHLQNLHWISC